MSEFGVRSSEEAFLQYNLSSIVNKHEDYERRLNGDAQVEPDIRERLIAELRDFETYFDIWTRKLSSPSKKARYHSLKHLFLEALSPGKLDIFHADDNDPVRIWDQALPDDIKFVITNESKRLLAWLIASRGSDHEKRLFDLYQLVVSHLPEKFQTTKTPTKADINILLPTILELVSIDFGDKPSEESISNLLLF